MAARGPKMADGVWKGVYPWVFVRFHQLSLNKFLDPSTPSMRKVDEREKRKKKRKEKLACAEMCQAQLKLGLKFDGAWQTLSVIWWNYFSL